MRPKARRRAFLTLGIGFYENAAGIIGKASYENQYFFGRADNLQTILREEKSRHERTRPAMPNERVSNANNSEFLDRRGSKLRIQTTDVVSGIRNFVSL